MRLWVLSALESSPTDALLLQAAEVRGHEVQLVRPWDAVRLLELGDRPDGILPRTGASAPEEALEVLAQLESMGIAVLNGAQELARARDKWSTYEALRAADVPTPPTVRLELAKGLVGEIGEPPWYVKPAVGTQGRGVRRVTSTAELPEPSQEERWIVQREVRGTVPGDVRVLVVDGTVLAAMRRRPAPDEHRANLHRGGQALPLELDEGTAACAREAAGALGLGMAGVDLIPTTSGPYVLEVNGAPGLVGLVGLSSPERDLPGDVVCALEARVATPG